ncbi:flagellar basal body rod modification protein [Zhengella mangrovi]|uniref:Basal-body rod modification protein FlgD n=1 Tax=Zhengella mangrovi TaxID=1982044 RepID=A0A2G1QKI4_9HYPH|nr:flagellar hook assembly protein FlgD [Zhengella mangrovi]PHP65708.1 flagellar basal body rod modification protein [Zhengella mangrovi]
MTPVSATTAAATPSAPASQASTSNMLNYDTFLQILVTEMQNQDPTEPMDASQYVSQLASFSNVEQNIQTNNKLDILLAASVVSQAGSVIGHTITSADGNVTGVVSEVRIGSSGLIAILEDGTEVPVTVGTVISE